MRGTVRNDLRPGLRFIGFRHYGTVAFYADEDNVEIVRILGRGRDLISALDNKGDPPET
jgi:plasmid stabilization system protein ParE